MNTQKTTPESINHVANFVWNRGVKQHPKAHEFELQTLNKFVAAIRQMAEEDNGKRNGQQARWSKVTSGTMMRYVEMMCKRNQNTFRTEQEVYVIDDFLKYTYRQARKRYTNICESAITTVLKLNNREYWD